MKRARLVLAKETLVRLGPDELAGVDGGGAGGNTLTFCGVCDRGLGVTETCVTYTCV